VQAFSPAVSGRSEGLHYFSLLQRLDGLPAKTAGLVMVADADRLHPGASAVDRRLDGFR
jgi:hypothetical protein